MNRHVSRSNWKLLPRTAVIGIAVCLLSLALAAPVFATDGTAPKINRPPHPRPAGVKVPTPNGSVGGGGGTGETTIAKAAILYCNSRLYVAWTGTDTAHHLYIGWGSTGGSFPNKHQINDTIAGVTGPALACYNPDGTGTKLFVASGELIRVTVSTSAIMTQV